MKVKELPDDEREGLYARLRAAGYDPAEVAELGIHELALSVQAHADDLTRKIERNHHRSGLEGELNSLLRPVEAKHPGLPLSKAAWFLPQAEQQQVYAILRELNQLSRPVLVTYGRKSWHAAVEQVIEVELHLDFARDDGVHGFMVTSEEALDAMIDHRALRVLAQDSTWPPDLVRRYAEQLLSTLAGLPR